MEAERTAEEQAVYFNLLAEIGHTKHIGGQTATLRLVELIEPDPSDMILDVGCGVGIAPVFLAERFRCHVVGVDVTPRMIERAQERAARHNVAHLTSFRVADMHDLPFDDNSFNAAIAESVLTFSAQKTAVIAELARVVRPGGFVAFTEAIWLEKPPPGKAEFMARAAGMPQGILAHDEWREILEASSLTGIVAEAYPISARQEARSQRERTSLGDYVRAIPGFFRAIARPEYRQVFRSAAGSIPKDYYKHVAYGVYGGRVTVVG